MSNQQVEFRKSMNKRAKVPSQSDKIGEIIIKGDTSHISSFICALIRTGSILDSEKQTGIHVVFQD